MSIQNVLKSLFSTSPRRPIRRRPTALRPRVEALEDRCVPATLLVNTALDVTLADDGLVTLREAIVAANTDTATDLGQAGSGADTIVFDPSMLGQPIQLLEGELSIVSDLVIQGPGAPLLTIDASHLSRLFSISSNNAELRGLTLTGGQAEYGGAIAAYGNLKVVDSVLAGNTAMQIPVSTDGITAEYGFSDIFTIRGYPIPYPSYFYTSVHSDSDSGDGGAIYHWGGKLTLSDSVVDHNAASRLGGGIVSDHYDIKRSTVSSNTAGLNHYVNISAGFTLPGGGGPTDPGVGASSYGGGVFGVGEMTDSTISGNTAVYGGGVYGGGTFTNSTISGNTAAFGGGVYGSGTFTNSTIAFNQAVFGAGIYAYYPLTLRSTIVGSNLVGQDIQGTYNAEHSLIGGTPMLAPLADNGGPTWTHALLPGSPAINTGANPLNLASDQRGAGFPRVLHGAADIGAYESDSELLPPPLPPSNITVTPTSGLVTTEAGGTASFSVSLNEQPLAPVTITVDTSDTTEGLVSTGGSAPASSVTLTFTPLDWATRTVTVTGVDDTALDGDIAYTVRTQPAVSLDPAYSGVNAADVAVVNRDNDLPSLAITDRTVTEGNSGTVNASFTVTLSSTSTQTVTVNFATAEGTAKGGSDYTSASGTLTFNPGETSKTITVLVKGDTMFEPNESFTVNLSNPTNASLADGQGQGTIVNDDSRPKMSISDVTKKEGHSGMVAFVFTVTLSGASSETITVNYATADGSAQSGSDYQAASGLLTFNPGETTKTITVWVYGDKVKESNVAFYVDLFGATNSDMLDSRGIGTILNDDR